MAIHDKILPFKCDVCEKVSFFKYFLKTLIIIWFQYFKAFVQKNKLKNHMRDRHAEEKSDADEPAASTDDEENE